MLPQLLPESVELALPGDRQDHLRSPARMLDDPNDRFSVIVSVARSCNLLTWQSASSGRGQVSFAAPSALLAVVIAIFVV